mmetsp:Transcript_23541/g.73679  ORF Transcript_23541/g.73679 Transcript_23541/m.73679 type:complete len:153 (+) Transcript_23541:54-512(+)
MRRAPSTDLILVVKHNSGRQLRLIVEARVPEPRRHTRIVVSKLLDEFQPRARTAMRRHSSSVVGARHRASASAALEDRQGSSVDKTLDKNEIGEQSRGAAAVAVNFGRGTGEAKAVCHLIQRKFFTVFVGRESGSCVVSRIELGKYRHHRNP